MYVPTHLGGVHKTLLQFGHNMRQKHGPEFKRNIRFEDAELSLVVDIKLPGRGAKWMTISYEHALSDRRALSSALVSDNIDMLTSQPATQEQSTIQAKLIASRLDGLPGTGTSRSSLPSSSSTSTSSSSGQAGLNGTEEPMQADNLDDVWTSSRK